MTTPPGATPGQLDVVVLGGGMAGLTAARALAERGFSVLVLEARARVGGRVLSERTPQGDVVELGAEFVHGRAPELWSLIDEARVETTERDGAMLRETPGSFLVDEDDSSEEDRFSSLDTLADLQPDQAFVDWLATSSLPQDERAALTGYVEGFNAADAQRISALSLGIQQRADDAIEADRAWHLREGYTQLPEFLAARVRELGTEIRLQAEAVAVRWKAGRVEVELLSGERLHAPRCIVTLPLGVLQRGRLVFQPEPHALPAARRLVMGDAARFTLVFRDAWWQESKQAPAEALRQLHFLFTQGRVVPVWWTTHPESQRFPTLTGWAGGPQAAALTTALQGDFGTNMCTVLAEVFALPAERVRSALLSAHTHEWSTDPYSLGSYSYVPVGAIDAPGVMARPEADTLFFAGEHTDTSGHWGTVHAAIRTGLRAAAQVLGDED